MTEDELRLVLQRELFSEFIKGVERRKSLKIQEAALEKFIEEKRMRQIMTCPNCGSADCSYLTLLKIDFDNPQQKEVVCQNCYHEGPMAEFLEEQGPESETRQAGDDK